MHEAIVDMAAELALTYVNTSSPPRRASVSAQGPACHARDASKHYSVRRLNDSIERDCYRGAAIRLNTMVLAAICCAAVLSIALFLAFREAVAEDLDSASARMPGCRNQLNEKSARDLLDAYTQGICAGARESPSVYVFVSSSKCNQLPSDECRHSIH